MNLRLKIHYKMARIANIERKLTKKERFQLKFWRNLSELINLPGYTYRRIKRKIVK